jgi:hypothetical protein
MKGYSKPKATAKKPKEKPVKGMMSIQMPKAPAKGKKKK